MRMQRSWLLALLLMLLGLATAQSGAALYGNNCAACHGASGEGVPGVFPPLKGNPNVEDPAYVAKVIREGKSGPLEVNGQTYNGAMPPFPQLSDAEVEALARYIAAGLSEAPAPKPAPKAAKPKGDPVRGRALFLGEQRFQNGGSPCVACHTAKSVGALGGGALGPDLSDVAQRFGSALPGVIKQPGFKVMRVIYRDKPLTDQEAQDVAAFLAEGGSGPSVATAGSRLLGLGFLGFLVLFLGMFPFWPRQRETYLQRLRRRK